jgi:hypothetical protein
LIQFIGLVWDRRDSKSFLQSGRIYWGIVVQMASLTVDIASRALSPAINDPTTAALADISDLQGAGGNRSGARAGSRDLKPAAACAKAS